MSRQKYRAQIAVFDRRDLLKMGAASLAVAGAGCDTLSLPEVQLLDFLAPILDNDDFYVQSAYGTPEVNISSHVLRLLDEGTEVATISLADLEALPSRKREHSLQCIGSNPRYPFVGNAIWGGLPFREVLEHLGVSAAADRVWMRMRGADDYSTAVPVTDLDGTGGADPMWLVWTMNDEPLPADHGSPFRFLIPGRYGTKNVKWPVELEFTAEEHLGTWERLGWSQEATYQTNGLILSPPSMSLIGTGTVKILGSAFAGHTQIEEVEITTDGGATWEPVEITYRPTDSQSEPDVTDVNPGRHIWTIWQYEWTLNSPGDYTIQVRVKDENGVVSAADPEGVDPLDGYDGGMEILLKVT